MRAWDGRDAPFRKLSTRSSRLEGFCKTERGKRRARALSSRNIRRPLSTSSSSPSSWSSLPSSSVGYAENSAPLQLTIAIKILPRAPSYELRTLAGRLTFATFAVTSERIGGGEDVVGRSEDLVSTGDKRSMLQRVRISFPEGRRRVYWD